MTTPLSDPDNVMMVPVEGGFTDDEIQRILNGQPLVASAAETFHLPGRHDQETHGHGHGGGSGSGSGSGQKSSGKALKITHVLVHKKHEPGTTIAITSDGKKRARWDGKQYELQQKSDDGSWETEQTAIKSKAYVAVNAYASDWTTPADDDDNDTEQVSTPDDVSPPKSQPSDDKPKTTSAMSTTPTMRAMRAAYDEGYVVEHTFTEGKSGAVVELLRLSDNSKVVRKSGFTKLSPEMNTLRQEYLATRVYGASDDSAMTAVQLDDDSLLVTFAPGVSGAQLENRAAADAARASRNAPKAKQVKARFNAAMAERERQVSLVNGDKIAILDWVTNKTDRHNMNLTVDDDTVYPVDQGHTFKYTDVNGQEVFPVSPFVNHWVGLSNYYTAKLKPKLSKVEVARQRAAVELLRSEFSGEGESAWFDSMMKRFDQLEAKATK